MAGNKNCVESINHLFMGHSWLLVSQMILKIVENSSSFKHHFVIIINAPNQKERYDLLFKNIRYDDYEYWYYLYSSEAISENQNRLKCLYVLLLAHCVLIRFESVKKWLLIFGKIRKCGFKNIIIHSELILAALFLSLRWNIKIDWCCWGGVPDYSNISFREFFRLRYHYRRFLRRCHHIITLTEADKSNFERTYGFDNIILTSYSYIYNFDPTISIHHNNTNNILVGNSAFYLDEYLDISKSLSRMKGLNITFMCSYGVDFSSERWEQWKNKVTEILVGNDLHFWTQNVPLTEYNSILRSYDVYISPIHRQSGLGAITTALRFGLKCYLAGVNYEYCIGNGFIAYHCDDIQNIDCDSLLKYDDMSRMHNMHRVEIVCNSSNCVEEWNLIYSKLLQ